jgi:hypothetical protein
MRRVHAPVVALVLLAAAAASGAAPSLRVEITTLLDSSVKNTPPAIAASRSQYERLKRAYPRNQRLDYAYAVVLINQRKYHDALPLLSQYLETAKRDISARRTKVMALIQDKRAADALQEAILLSQCLSEGDDANRERDYLEAAEFLGAVFGYLELVRPTAVDAQARTKGRDTVVSHLDDRVDAFDRGRNAVAEQWTDFQKDRESEKDQVTATSQRRRDQARQALDEDKKKAVGHAETAQAGQQDLQDAQRELSMLQTQLASLQNDRSRLTAQISAIQAQMQQLTTASSTFSDQTQPGNPRPVIQTTTQTQTIPFDRAVQATSLTFNLVTLNKQAFDMDRKILALQAKAAEATGKGNEGLEAREKSTAAIREAEKRAKVAERQLRQRVPTSNARIAAINAKMTNFATYAPFPYEREKERVLGWFAK